jgi:hypothetical protein
MAQLFDTLRPVDAGSLRADAGATIRDLVALLGRPEMQTAFLGLAGNAVRTPAVSRYGRRDRVGVGPHPRPARGFAVIRPG